MKKIITLFIITTLCFSQQFKYKLLEFTKADELTTTGITLGNNLYFVVSYIDLAETGAFPEARKSKLIKTDRDLNVIASIDITPDTLKNFMVNHIFPLTNPITLETSIGFIGTSSTDSIGLTKMGTVNLSLSQVNHFANNLFVVNLTPNNPNPYFWFTKILQVNDTTLLALVKNKTNTFNSYLASLKYNGTSITLMDTLKIDSANKWMSFFTLSNQVGFLKNNSGILEQVKINSYSPLVLSSSVSLSPSSYLPGAVISGPFNETYLRSSNDTVYTYFIITSPNTGISGQNYHHYLHRWKNNNGFILLDDSLLIDISPYQGGGDNIYELLSVSSSYIYTVASHYRSAGIEPFFFSSYEYLHTSFMDTSNAFKIHKIGKDSFVKKWSLLLGDDDYYSVRGILTLSDTSCIVYGWRFPLGDTTRTDGDAFVWKITDLGIVTSLGASPRHSLILYPNPTTDLLKVRSNEAIRPDIGLYTLNGKLLRKKTFPKENEFTLHLSNLPSGTYLLEIQTSSGRKFTEKVVIE